MSFYVGDFKVAGAKENIGPMWKALMKSIDLEPLLLCRVMFTWDESRSLKLLTPLRSSRRLTSS